MFGISMEHLLVLGAILLLFGPRRLPELGQGLGKAIKNFRDAFTGVEEAKYKQLNAEKEAAPEKPAVAVAKTKKKKEPEQPS
jgi:sec-independent protein translocase protein TatA